MLSTKDWGFMMSKYISEKDSGWLLLDCKNQNMPAGLYLVATPIGNLADITVRALEILSRADLVVCEDKRVTSKLLKAYDLSKPLLVYNDHSDDGVRQKIMDTIRGGSIVVLVSDAGTPLISDPGYKLVRDCYEAGIYVSSLPGANAPLTALQLSGLPSDRFLFLGFVPSKVKARQMFLTEWFSVSATLVMFETAPRLLKCLEDIQLVMGGRQVAVVRELTKLHEEVRRGDAAALLEYYRSHDLPRGEIVLVIEGAVKGVHVSDDTLESELEALMMKESLKDSVRIVSEKSGVSHKKIYDMALVIKGRKNGESL